MLEHASTLGLLFAFALGARAQESFPSSTALAEGVSPEGLAGLSGLVQGLVDDEEIVGAELLVIKNGRSILHEAYGWSDREAQVPMETERVFCVRSMTKPVIAAAVLMLVDDDELELDDRVAQYLPAFDVEGTREITVEQLLTHTSGLPMSLLLGEDLRELDGIQAVAALGGGYELEFEPGEGFNYSDQGTDTLTALIEVIAGVPVADFVRERVLDPLGMQESACVFAEESPLRARSIPKYVGSRGEWTRFWSPDDPPLFPFFLGSQGLYSTLEDYARFMRFWQKKGRVDGERLIAARYVRKALTPGPHPMNSGTGFTELRSEYGFLMQLWTAPGKGDRRELAAFGHSGSDGTHAWVFPEQDAMVLYFTQSRGSMSGLRVEEALAGLFLGAPYDPNQAAPPFEEYLGYYWEGEGDLYRAIVRDGEDLALEIIGKAVVPLTYAGEDRWKFRPNPSVVLAFDRSEAGVVTGYHIGDHQEFRFEPSAGLPSADEVAERVVQAHRMDLLETAGPVRMVAALTIEKQGISGETDTLLAWPDRWRTDSVAGEETERVSFDGENVWYESRAEPLATLEGPRAEVHRMEGPFVRFGDWRKWYPRACVIQRLEEDGRGVLLVRTDDTSAPARTMYVEEETGLVRSEGTVTVIPNLGRIGQRMVFDEYRDVAGMQLPYRTRVLLANPLIGPIVTTIDKVELNVEVPEGAFRLGR